LAILQLRLTACNINVPVCNSDSLLLYTVNKAKHSVLTCSNCNQLITYSSKDKVIIPVSRLDYSKSVMHCLYDMPDLWLTSQLQSVTIHCVILTYVTWTPTQG